MLKKLLTDFIKRKQFDINAQYFMKDILFNPLQKKKQFTVN